MADMINDPLGIEYVQWASLKGAVKLESKGLKHSSGKSMRKLACERLGLKPRTPYEQVIAAIEQKMADLLLQKQNKE